MTMKIEIFSKANCPNCREAKRILLANNFDYTEYDVGQPEHLVELMLRHPEARQMPQIFVDGQRVGGLAGLLVALDVLL